MSESLEERTLVVRNIDGDRLTEDLLEELFANFGPVVKIVLRKNFAFIEYTKKESVGYAWAMTDGISLYGRPLRILPKLEDDPSNYTHRDQLDSFMNRILTDKTYFNSLLTEEQLAETQQLTDALKSQDMSTAKAVRCRLRQYQLHCEPRSTYNAILDRDLCKEVNRHENSNSSFWDQHSRYPHPSSPHQRSHSLGRDHRRSFDNHDNYQPGYPPLPAPIPQSGSYYHSQPDLQSWPPPIANNYGDRGGGNHPDWGHYEQHPYEPPHGHNQHRQYQQPSPYLPHRPPHPVFDHPHHVQAPLPPPGHGHFQPHPNHYRPYPPPNTHHRY